MQKSHAHVARELGLNRQQFNGYITGKNLPNERVIDNICAYFQVDVGALFREADPETDFTNLDALADRQKKYLDRIIAIEKSSHRHGLTDGLYYVYFSVPRDRELVACSLLAVKREGGLTTFRRITRLGGISDGRRPKTRSIHSGVVLYRENYAFLIGLDTIDNGGPTILVASPMTSSEILYSGQGHVATGSDFDIVQFYITASPKRTKIWKAMNRVKIHSLNEILTYSKKIYDRILES